MNEKGERIKRPCGRQVMEGGDRCIFHDAEAWRTHAEIMREEIKSKIEKGDLNFYKYHFPEIDFSNIVKEFKELTEFNKTIFHGNVTFKYIDFARNAIFNGVMFLGVASFIGVKFTGGVQFRETTFSEITMFDGATFSELTWFFQTVFLKTVGFNDTTFSGITMFDKVTFEKNTGFNRVTFKGVSQFNNAIFNENAVFINLQIFKTLEFNQIIIQRILTLLVGKWMPQTINPQYQSICLVQIRNVIIKENGKFIISGSLGAVSLELVAGISLLNNDLTLFEFIDETWIREGGKQNGRKIIIDEIFLEKQAEGEEKLPYNPTPDHVSQTYRRLRDNYENARRYSEAGDFYIGEMEILRKYGPSLLNRILYNVYDILAVYGESVSWPLIWILILVPSIAGFRCIFLRNPPLELFLVEYFKELSSTVKAFFPFNRISKIRDILTRLVGSLLLGLTFIAIRRRLERR